MERYIHPCLSMAEKGFVNGFFEAIPLTIAIGENGLKKDVGKLLKISFWLKKLVHSTQPLRCKSPLQI